MKARILWVPPAVRHLTPGKVYNLPQALAATLIAAGEAEEAAGATDVEAYDPPIEEAADAPADAAAKAPAKRAPRRR